MQRLNPLLRLVKKKLYHESWVNEDPSKYVLETPREQASREIEKFTLKKTGFPFFYFFLPPFFIGPYIGINISQKTVEFHERITQVPFIYKISDVRVEVTNIFFSMCTIENKTTGKTAKFRVKDCEKFKRRMDELS